MGCDIHAYIDFDDGPGHDGKPYVKSFGGRIDLGRNYELFGLMAGVRGGDPIYPPRGLPEHVSWETDGDYKLFVVDEVSDSSGQCSRQNAEKWVKQGSSEWAGNDKRWITNPDWHNPSWLTVGELREVQQAYERANGVNHTMLEVVIAVMDVLEREISNCSSRLVFWFDN